MGFFNFCLFANLQIISFCFDIIGFYDFNLKEIQFLSSAFLFLARSSSSNVHFPGFVPFGGLLLDQVGFYFW